MSDTPDPWAQLWDSLRLLAVDPVGLGGLVLQGRACPLRDAVLAALPDLALPVVKLHPGLSDAALLGDMDVAATLTGGRLITRPGLLARPAAFRLSMAERCPAHLAARIAARLDQDSPACLIALEEAVEEGEATPLALCERLAFHCPIDGLRGPLPAPLDPRALQAARARLPETTPDPAHMAALVSAAAALGIDSLRAPLFALRAARARAAFEARQITDADLEAAATLVFAHRATRLPDSATDPQNPPEPPQEPQEPPETGQGTGRDEMLVEAVRVALPEGLLTRTRARSRVTGSQGAGARQKTTQRGRPLPARRTRPDGRSRIDMIATLRAAAPWQTLRRRPGRQVIVLPSDIHLKRYETRSERVLIFLVDASGSAAHARLNEAKGAVEHLLARAYASRDRVALVGFRGTGAEILLPPSRSLLLAKTRLSALPGGGATPLAAALQQGGQMANAARKQALSPTLVLLTDGRSNVALDGSHDRSLAARDADGVADWLCAQGIDALVLDTGLRPKPALKALADRMGAAHLALPRSDAAALSQAISDAAGP